jgi:LAS superfamily LD-carboxypeptidase LdcB
VIGRLAGVALVIVVAVVAGQLALRGAGRTSHAPGSAQTAAIVAPGARSGPPQQAAPGGCEPAPAFTAAAAQNAQSMQTAVWGTFHRQEAGWETYAPLAAKEIGVACAPDDPGFAAALAPWQRAHHLPANGVMDALTLQAMANAWEARRPFVAVSARGLCPAPPTDLATTTAVEAYGGQPAQLRPNALAAYRRMVAAARAAAPILAGDRRMLTIVSGYRDPVADSVRCATENNCDNLVRSTCSAHRTGLAVDLFLGSAPGYRPDSAADANRLYQSKSTAYRWLVAHAAEYGFVNYPFEPWHWEWTGEAP